MSMSKASPRKLPDPKTVLKSGAGTSSVSGKRLDSAGNNYMTSLFCKKLGSHLKHSPKGNTTTQSASGLHTPSTKGIHFQAPMHVCLARNEELRFCERNFTSLLSTTNLT